jgi:hypothetical protein
MREYTEFGLLLTQARDARKVHQVHAALRAGVSGSFLGRLARSTLWLYPMRIISPNGAPPPLKGQKCSIQLLLCVDAIADMDTALERASISVERVSEVDSRSKDPVLTDPRIHAGPHRPYAVDF